MARPRKAKYCACGEMTQARAGRRHHVCFRLKQKGGRPPAERCLCGKMTAEQAAKQDHECKGWGERLRTQTDYEEMA